MFNRFTPRIMPGFGLSLGYTIFYLSLIVLIPFSALFTKTFSGSWAHIWESISEPRVLASYKLSFGVSFLAALVNGFFGLITAWVLARYEFPGRRFVDALVDLPFALPTAVAGIALTALYSTNGPIGSFLFEHFNLRVAYTPLGIFVALTFIGLPFVVRTLQPVILDLHADVEEAAACLGATRWQTFTRIILPALLPALGTGIMLAFGRAVGEYGSVVFIAGNLPLKTEITPLLIITKLEQYDYSGAAAIGLAMLLASFVILLLVNLIQWWNDKRTAHDTEEN
ncbi:MAG: sulfate ABC transporter permease subunit CysT [Verrucomicrobia bacterium Tous-C9LFEB]|nr:MAG: sulfate ABC transporter permease subunit CysT [Verrucomicrobia bacterium Tous-C9LFEB]